MKLAHELANGPTIALSLIRKLYWDSPENSFEDQLNLEFQSQRIAGAAEDFKEGVTRLSGEASRQIQRQMMEALLGRCVASWYPGATGVTSAVRLSGGASQETWSFDIVHPDGNIGAILRRAPQGYGAAPARAAGLNAEAMLMQRAYEAGVPSPRVLHVLQPKDELGTGFIMERVRRRNHPAQDPARWAVCECRAPAGEGTRRSARRDPRIALQSLPELRRMTAAKEIDELERDYRSFHGRDLCSNSRCAGCVSAIPARLPT